ncbi:hypothetical protein M404DRAFT_1003679 [Pisolithus tinctorius Marx 270]|uniref:Uncharacterized protein n=1 Tax=Pisolithus tinctorius Marx 270 TaxID=870435 RepID=A0A0C3NZX9_PISTI|nr:hypothetical protein M404DRAFT_1003679 [Pisolithus tinctorius Marx 270]
MSRAHIDSTDFVWLREVYCGALANGRSDLHDCITLTAKWNHVGTNKLKIRALEVRWRS